MCHIYLKKQNEETDKKGGRERIQRSTIISPSVREFYFEVELTALNLLLITASVCKMWDELSRQILDGLIFYLNNTDNLFTRREMHTVIINLLLLIAYVEFTKPTSPIQGRCSGFVLTQR